jgi:Protein of unknown function (DUF3037)
MSEFAFIRWIPDVFLSEFVNVGVIAFDGPEVEVLAVQNWTRAANFAQTYRGQDFSWLPGAIADFCGRLRETFERDGHILNAPGGGMFSVGPLRTSTLSPKDTTNEMLWATTHGREGYEK